MIAGDNVVPIDQARSYEPFPEVDTGVHPLGSKVLVQVKTPRSVTRGGIIVVDEAKETDQWQTQVAKVVQLGPLAFCDRDTMKPWIEGAWCTIGDFVRVPLHGGDKFKLPVPGRPAGEFALFVLYEDVSLVARLTGDIEAITAYI